MKIMFAASASGLHDHFDYSREWVKRLIALHCNLRGNSEGAKCGLISPD